MAFFDNVLKIFSQGKKAATDLYKGSGAFDEQTNLGIARNTALGILNPTQYIKNVKSTVKPLITSDRGFTEEQIKSATPTIKEKVKSIPKIAGELASFAGNLASYNPLVESIAQTKVGGKLADVGRKIEQASKPKTAGEAKSMQLLDYLSVIPTAGVGSIKASSNAAKTIAKSNNVREILALVKSEVPNITDDVAMAVSNTLKNVKNEGLVNAVLQRSKKALEPVVEPTIASRISSIADNSLEKNTSGVRPESVEFYKKNPQALSEKEIRLRETPEGRLVVEDGRHALEAARQMGVDELKIRDVTPEYASVEGAVGPKSKILKQELPKGKVSPTRAVDGKFTGSVSVKSSVPNLEEVVTKSKTTPLKEKVALVDYVRTPEKVFKKIGLDKQFTLLRNQYDKYFEELPKNIEKITNWSKQVPKESNQRIFKYLDGQDVKLTPQESKIAGEIRTYLEDWANRLEIPKEKRITNYITRLFDADLVKGEFDEDLAKIIDEQVAGSTYNPFLNKRYGVQGYKEDVWQALDAYTKRATRKVHMDPALESIKKASDSLEKSQFDYIKSFIDKVNMRPGKVDTLFDNGMRQLIGNKLGTRPTAALSRKLRRMTFRGMLGGNISSALRNLSQGVNTYAKLGEKYTLLGYLKLFGGGIEEAKTAGVLADNFIQDRTLSATKKFMEKLDKTLFLFFDTVEKVNRAAAFNGAKAQAISKGMDEAKAIEYAKKLVRDTQFSYSAIDTPVAMNGDIAKVMLQFMTYPVKQTEFLAGMAKNKEFLGIARYVLGASAFLWTVGEAFNMDPLEFVPFSGVVTGQTKLGTPPSLKLPVEITKAAFDAKGKYGQDRDTKEKLADIGKAGVGVLPAGVQAKKTIEGVDALQQGGSYDAAGRLQYKVGGTLPKDIQAILFGKYASGEAADFFDKKKSPEKTKAENDYQQVKSLIEQGREDDAVAYYESLSDEEKEEYKTVRASERSKKTKELRLQMIPVFSRIRKMALEGNEEQARIEYDALTDQEKEMYQKLREEYNKK